MAAPASTVSGAEALPRASTDVGDLLGKSPSSPGAEVQHRNPIITDLRVRGYHVGELTTILDGGYLFPAREDLDTVVSKVDSHLIRDAVLIKGPYTVRYGPGFAFLTVDTLGSPRYENGFEAHELTSLAFKTNGSQWRGRQSFWGGDSDWGFRIGYDLMSGDDYFTGHGNRIPSGYLSGNLDAAFGFDLSPDSHLELHILRQDQQNVQLPGQAFDLNSSITDAYSVRYVLENQEYFDRFVAEAWYNYTRFDGDNLRPAKRAFIFNNFPPGLEFVGFTDGDIQVPGYRTYVTWGKDKCPQLSVGSDLRYQSQRLNEFDTFGGVNGFNAVPRSHLLDPGAFIDGVLPLWDGRMTLKAGARADWATANIDSLPPALDQDTTLIGRQPNSDFGRAFDLWSAYLTAEYKWTDHWTGLIGAGQAQRPPTTTELYAFQPLLATVQNGFNFTSGNANLVPEQLWQTDLGLRADYDTFRFGLTGFYSWIHDYLTFLVQPNQPGTPPLPFNRLQFINTPRATLSGFESYGEWDTYEWLTPFYVMSFVEGRDYARDNRPTVPKVTSGPQEPLPGIPPFEATLGLRVHEGRKNPRWGVELAARLVAAQNRVALSLGEVGTPGFTVVNLRSYWQVNQHLLLTAGVENVGNTFYREALDLRTGLGVAQPGINFYFGTQLQY